MPKYLIHIGICGFGNQLLGFKEACIIAKHTGRTMIAPIFIPHGTIRSTTKSFYHFSDIFDEKIFRREMDIVDISDISSNISNIYTIRRSQEDNLSRYYYNF